MFTEIMNENSTPQKILSFLQSALLKQKDVQQFLHFRPSDGASESLDDSLLLLLKESYSPDSGSTIYYKRSVIPDLPDLKYTV